MGVSQGQEKGKCHPLSSKDDLGNRRLLSLPEKRMEQIFLGAVSTHDGQGGRLELPARTYQV